MGSLVIIYKILPEQQPIFLMPLLPHHNKHAQNCLRRSFFLDVATLNVACIKGEFETSGQANHLDSGSLYLMRVILSMTSTGG